jgi:hypothetical protein
MPVRGMIASAERTAPDLPTATASALPVPKATTETARQRYVLPKNLRNAVKHLSDGELDLMYAAILEEMKRRGKTPKRVEADLQTLRSRFYVRPPLMKLQSPSTEKRRRVDITEDPLIRGQVNETAYETSKQSTEKANATSPNTEVCKGGV